MLKAVLFDFDGTLLDRETSLLRFVQQQYQRLHHFLGYVPKSQYVQRFIQLDANGSVWKDRVYQQLVTEFELYTISWQALLEDYKEKFQQTCVGFAGLEEMLQTLKNDGYMLGIITNGRDPFQMKNIKALRIYDYFAVILISEREGVRKPNGEIFQRALNQLNGKANETVFVGDNPKADIEAAQKMGMKGIWKENGYWGECPNADEICRELKDIPGLVEKLSER